ncbi:hypothetical protein JCGZ_18251 [Jatropha curcas]|uniref:non-specific serine/threonine protein kinase n=1 Tax=Jatropha curcas TaxID=180498 RepID=A0A067KAP6_JATCU|nr:proline-rich receptor-like protein kinase PERK9 [Jatropha curcas]XP_020538098.1 proline-rich receptor-like protein kinase PERK9 [Jatropha curcas]KDP29330.1 hypothetical protein JCGZ_18251 [Jatropha curcas]
MATTSPPNSSPSAVPPAATTTPPPPPSTANSPPSNSTPPPQSSSPLPDPPATSPPSQPNVDPPDPPTPSPPFSPPPQSSPTGGATPPSSSTTPPPQPPPAAPRPPPTASPPPPTANADPPTPSPPPPPPQSASPPVSPPSPPTPSDPPSSPPPPSNPPRSPLPPSSTPPPPTNSPPTASPNPPQNPPPPSEPPKNSPPSPPSSKPPENSPPPSQPPSNSTTPPPVTVPPPRSSRLPPASIPPTNSPPPPAPVAPTPRNAPSPPRVTSPPPSQPTPAPSNATPRASPPSPVIRFVPPPSLNSPPSSSPSSSDNNTIPSAPESSNLPSGGIGTGAIVAIGVAVGIIMLSLVGLAVWCVRKRRKAALGLNGGYIMPSPLGSSSRSDTNFTKTHSTTAPLMGSGSSTDFVYSPSEPGGLGNSRSWFTYEELLKATNGFSSQNLLGEGGFGSVYKGSLPDGREVAVKQLKVGGGQGEREFKAEVEIISRIHHRHLVSLVGYCISENRRLLVYDYVPNNTLHFHLHGEGRPVLDWTARVKIAAGAARGIAYLHEDCHPRIIHRDIKSSNILLDNNFEAKVSDFGLAKLALDANTHVTTRVMGTFGYMAPEYASSGKLTEKSDVFSYGVVLLELITGRKPVDASQPLGDESLVEWARPLLGHALANEEFDGLVDPRLEKNYDEGAMFRMIEAAAACVRHLAAKRPRMGQIVRAFDSLATEDLSNGMKVGESEVFNSAQQSAEIRLFRRMAFGSQNYSTDFFTQGSSDNRG